MLLPLDKYITLPLHDFCAVTGLGSTLVRQMVKDGRLQAVRIGKKKLLIVVQSYLDLIAKQANEGDPGYSGADKAREVRKAKREADQREKTDDILSAAGL